MRNFFTTSAYFTVVFIISVVNFQCAEIHKERHRKIDTDGSRIVDALISFFVDKGSYPQTDDLTILFPYYIPDKQNLFDQWGNPYKFHVRSYGDNRYEIIVLSLGADEQPGGEGINQDEQISQRFP
jgi:hypothetical protein